MNRPIGVLVLLAAALASIAPLAADDGLESLRGAQPPDAESVQPEIKRWLPDSEPLPRDYVQQPPLIPHKIDGYKITANANKCLSCHSWATYREAGATKISQTHFEDRDRNVLANVAPRRYFCTQCHVPQTDAKPLVENEFEPVKAIRK